MHQPIFLDVLQTGFGNRLSRCIVEEEAAEAPLRRPPGLISRFFRWMTQPI